MRIRMARGSQSKKRFRALLELTRFPANTAAALEAHFVRGMDEALVCAMFDLEASNFSRSMRRINDINDVVERIKEHDTYHLNDKKAV